MSATSNNSIFFSSLDDVSLPPLKELGTQQAQPKSFPVLLQPEVQRLTSFSLLGTKQGCPRTFLIKELDFSLVSNTALKPYNERTSIVIDQTWVRTPTTYQEPSSYDDRNLSDQDVWGTLMFNSSQETTPVSQRYSHAELSAETTPRSFNQRLRQELSNKENDSENKEFPCTECDKIYRGKNARSILRRHLKDKHKIEQPRGTRWDNDPNRPKTDEERRQRMLESKRRSALKARERKNNQKVLLQHSNNNYNNHNQPRFCREPYPVSKAELSLILSPPHTPTTTDCGRNLCSSPAHYHINKIH
ncbi:7056_t:CDS:2 [Funneliformis caledonium]|uniref:7056_t:CDS:1 n=1 Tax=Funneliformis caledonium TaxID=1117310 RepID=A0A9N9C8W7_9GLOM|nr:7056_t:CDS:2 [Funneliformis caledonium]